MCNNLYVEFSLHFPTKERCMWELSVYRGIKLNYVGHPPGGLRDRLRNHKGWWGLRREGGALLSKSGSTHSSASLNGGSVFGVG